MPTYKISPWPFEDDEIVTLYWISSPVTEENGVRNMNVHFKTDNGFKTIKCPWGHLPLLQIGYKYKNGRISNEPTNLENFSVSYNYINNTDINTCYKIPKELYPLVPAGVNIKELCYKFTYNKITYYIPCIEIVRCLYASTPFFCENLLSSEDLNEFADITYSYINNDNININFYNNFPPNLFTSGNITDFIWFTQFDEIKKAREEIRAKYIKNKLIYSRLPNIKGCRIIGKGIKHDNTVLLLNINVVNLIFPYENIIATHPAYVNPIANSKGNISKSKLNVEDEINIGDNYKGASKTNPSSIGDLRPSKKFSTKINIEKVKRDAVTKKSIENSEKSDNKTTFTTQPVVLGANAQPVTFNIIDAIKNVTELNKNFENFSKAINILINSLGYKMKDIKYITLEGNSIFTQTSDGLPRQCVIAEIYYNSESFYIIEVNIEDGWSLSTLVFTSKGNNKTVSDIINSLIENNGHWNTIWFDKFLKDKYTTVRHFKKRTAFHWSILLSRAIEKLSTKL